MFIFKLRILIDDCLIWLGIGSRISIVGLEQKLYDRGVYINASYIYHTMHKRGFLYRNIYGKYYPSKYSIKRGFFKNGLLTRKGTMFFIKFYKNVIM